MVVALIGLLATAIVTDLRSSRIPNWLTISAMVFGLAGHAWQHGLQGLLFSLFGLFVGLGLFLLLHLSGSIGASDVKLMAVVGAMVGPEEAFLSALLAITVGGLYALGAMIYQFSLELVTRVQPRANAAKVAGFGDIVWRQSFGEAFPLRRDAG